MVEIQKKTKALPSRRWAPVDIDKIQHRLLMVLRRETEQLLDESYGKKLSENSSKSLVNYLKLLKDFQENELKALELLTDEELESRASVNTQKEQKNGK